MSLFAIISRIGAKHPPDHRRFRPHLDSLESRAVPSAVLGHLSATPAIVHLAKPGHSGAVVSTAVAEAFPSAPNAWTGSGEMYDEGGITRKYSVQGAGIFYEHFGPRENLGQIDFRFHGNFTGTGILIGYAHGGLDVIYDSGTRSYLHLWSRYRQGAFEPPPQGQYEFEVTAGYLKGYRGSGAITFGPSRNPLSFTMDLVR
jgi:hypothetical protein